MKNVVTDFGLVANGVTDNLAALNVAIAAYTTADGAWFWPAGTYILSATPSAIPNGSLWYGEGMTLTAIKGTRAAPSGTATLSVNGRTGVTLRDLHVTTTDDVNASQQCIDATSSTNFTCTNVKMSNAISAGMRAASKALVMRYTGGEVTNIYQDVSASGFSGDFSDSLIYGTYFHDNATQATNTRHCVYISGTANPKNTMVQNCVFRNYGGGNAVEFHGSGSGTIAGASYNLSVDNCVFDSTYDQPACVIQGTIGASFTNNKIYNVSGVVLEGALNWGFIVDGNVLTAGTVFEGAIFCTINSAINGGGRVTNNVYTKAPGFLDTGVGVYANGAVQGLTIADNSFANIYCGVLLTTNTAGNVNGVEIRDNKFSVSPGSVDQAAGRYVAIPTGLTAGIIVDGAIQNCKLSNNTCSGLNYELAFTTNVPATGSAGTADGVSFTSTAGATIGYFNGVKPTNHPLERVDARPL